METRKSREEKALAWALERERCRLTEKRPPRPRHPEKRIGTVLPKILDPLAPTAHPVVDILAEKWATVVGDAIACHSRPGYIKENTLYVLIDHPGWLTELKRLNQNFLLKKIQQARPGAGISRITLRLDCS